MALPKSGSVSGGDEAEYRVEVGRDNISGLRREAFDEDALTHSPNGARLGVQDAAAGGDAVRPDRGLGFDPDPPAGRCLVQVHGEFSVQERKLGGIEPRPHTVRGV